MYRHRYTGRQSTKEISQKTCHVHRLTTLEERVREHRRSYQQRNHQQTSFIFLSFGERDMIFLHAMKHLPYISLYTILYIFCTLFTACRDDIVILPTQTEQVAGASEKGGPTGLYILCEGNMGSNKASLDFMNLHTGTYTTNIYGANNPNVIKDLGDVGNDVDIYGNRLWAVINCSHKVEVIDKTSCIRIGQVEVPNCRYLAFANGKAYVSAYVAPVSLDPNAERGAIFEIDTATLQITRRCVVGYQPEEIAIIGDLLYVANSGGYRAPNYDSTLSVIDLQSFTEVRRIPLAINLHNVQCDAQNRLWVTSRGATNPQQAGKIFVLENEQIIRTFDLTANNMHICGDSVYLILNANHEAPLAIINTQTFTTQSFPLVVGTEGGPNKPYGIIVNPYNRDILLTDAENYVSSGMLYCFSKAGICKWKHRTSDIPAHMCFLYGTSANQDTFPPQEETREGQYLYRVLEYCPAPGQFINLMPRYDKGDTQADMLQKCTEALANNARGMVSLGGFGGYLTFCFDHAVQNLPDYDFQIFGNSFDGTSEPGIVQVSIDANQNGLPDDAWYELAGSEYHTASTTHHYQLTYTRENDNTILWSDNQANNGRIYRNAYHDQDYWPQWCNTALTMQGTLLASRTYMNGNNYAQQPCAWGYVDNLPNNNAAGNSFDISWAVDEAGTPVSLSHIDFIRVYTAVHESNTVTGELSTEITNAIDLHYK